MKFTVHMRREYVQRFALEVEADSLAQALTAAVERADGYYDAAANCQVEPESEFNWNDVDQGGSEAFLAQDEDGDDVWYEGDDDEGADVHIPVLQALDPADAVPDSMRNIGAV